MTSSHRSGAAETAHPQEHDAASEVEAGIRDFVRNDIAYLRRPVAQTETHAVATQGEQAPEALAGNVNTFIERIAGISLDEIERLISDLESMRDHLRAEGERVQREIAGYGQLSQTSVASARAIADSVTQWKQAIASRG